MAGWCVGYTSHGLSAQFQQSRFIPPPIFFQIIFGLTHGEQRMMVVVGVVFQHWGAGQPLFIRMNQ